MRRLVGLAGRIMVAFLLMGIFYPVIAATVVDDTQAEFDLGNYGSPVYTQWNSNRVELNAAGRTNLSGTYTSNVKDASATSIWNTIGWVESVSYKEELPNSGGSDAGADMSNNLLLYHLNEGSGAISDSSGNGNNGTTYNGVTYGATGKFNTALNFDGVDDYVQTDTNIAVSNATGWTAEAWIYCESESGSTNVILQQLDGTGTGRTWLHRRTDTNKLRSFIGGSFIESTTSINFNTWYHVAVTIGSGAGATKTLYVNGVAEASGTETMEANDAAFRIGRHKSPDATNEEWDGTIDEVAIYSKVLSASEILNHYKRGVLNLRLRVRSCNDAACSGESWSSYFTTPGPNATGQSNNRYFQYQAFFETEDSAYTPELQSVTIDYDLAEAAPVLSVGSPTSCPNQMTLTWSGAIPPVGRTISSYNIYRGTSPGVDTSGAPYANTPSSPYTDTAVSSSPGATYYYKVRALYDDASLGLESNENSGTTIDCVGTAPVLTATPTSNCPNRINLSWTLATPPVGKTIAGYNMYRSQTSPVDASGAPYASLGDVLAYQDANVPSVSGFTYYYVVRARYTDSTLGLESNEGSASTLLFCQGREPETYKNYMNNMSALASNKLSCCENEQAYALQKMAQEKGLAGTEEYLEAGKLIGQAEEYCVKAKQFYSGRNYVASNYCSSKACEFYKKAIAILEKLLAP